MNTLLGFVSATIGGATGGAGGCALEASSSHEKRLLGAATCDALERGSLLVGAWSDAAAETEGAGSLIAGADCGIEGSGEARSH